MRLSCRDRASDRVRGANGAGKTTAMRVIFGLVLPGTGEARWNGQPIDADVRRRFGYMPEERGLYPRMLVRDQLLFFGRLSGLSSSQAGIAGDRWLAALGLTDRASARLDDLSHGNQQRVQLATALVHDPALVVSCSELPWPARRSEPKLRHPMHARDGLRRIWVVADREFVERAKTRVFQLSTLAVLLAMAALIVLPALLSADAKTNR